MRLINADAIIKMLEKNEALLDEHRVGGSHVIQFSVESVKNFLRMQPKIDAVPLKVIENWLYMILVNNYGTDLEEACRSLIGRLEDLLFFYTMSEEKD